MSSAVVNLLKWAAESFGKRRKEAARKAAIEGLSFEHGGETIHLAWSGPPLTVAPEDQKPRVLSPELFEALKSRLAAEGVRATLDLPDGQKTLPIYETDAARTWKRQMKGAATGLDAKYILKFFP